MGQKLTPQFATPINVPPMMIKQQMTNTNAMWIKHSRESTAIFFRTTAPFFLELKNMTVAKKEKKIISLMTDSVNQGDERIEALKVHLAALPTYDLIDTHAAERQRVLGEMELGVLSVEKEQNDAQTRLVQQEEQMQELTLSWLDRLDDLCLIHIVSHLNTWVDVKRLYNALSRYNRKRVEETCCLRMIQIWCDVLFRDPKYLRLCFPAAPASPRSNEPCHRQTLCPRCYLNNKGYCFKCKQKALVDFDARGPTFGCYTKVKAETGYVGFCKDLLACPRCNATYNRCEASTEQLISDFDCECCAKGTQGCTNCFQRCRHCANVGCKQKNHYATLSIPMKDMLLQTQRNWDWCGECQSHHCCRKRHAPTEPWDYCKCPTFIGRKPPVITAPEARPPVVEMVISPQQPQRGFFNRLKRFFT